MDIVKGWQDVPDRIRRGSIAIGNFDGVHRGHQAVIGAARNQAMNLNVPLGVMTFEPYPRSYFQPNRPFFRLTTLEKKVELFRDNACDFSSIITFDQTLANLTAQNFMETVLVDAFAIKHVTVGFNFYFGKGREGNPQQLIKYGNLKGFGVTILEPKGDAGEIYSSTRIRELLAEGDVATAADMLGRWWKLSGIVEKGAGRGQGLGFPTANIRLAEGVALKHGIYAVRVHVDDRIIEGASYLGTRPTFDDGLPLLETFLFDFNGDLYGKLIEIEFIGFVRDDAKFKSSDSLHEQMNKDWLEGEAAIVAITNNTD